MHKNKNSNQTKPFSTRWSHYLNQMHHNALTWIISTAKPLTSKSVFIVCPIIFPLPLVVWLPSSWFTPYYKIYKIPPRMPKPPKLTLNHLLELSQHSLVPSFPILYYLVFLHIKHNFSSLSHRLYSHVGFLPPNTLSYTTSPVLYLKDSVF